MRADLPVQTQVVVTPQRVPWRDFQMLLLGALLLLLLIPLSEHVTLVQPLRLMLGMIYLFYAPGYCLVAALFPRQQDLNGVERLTLSIGLSIGVVPLLVLLLNQLPWGIRLWPIVVVEFALIGVCMAVALRRRIRLGAEAYTPTVQVHPRAWWRSLPALERRVYTAIAGVLLLMALATAWVFLTPAPDRYMTEFYMLGGTGLAEDYPRAARTTEEQSVTLGLTNREQAVHSYRVEVWVTDPHTGTSAQVQHLAPVTLVPGQSQRWLVTWRMPWAGPDQQVLFLLFTDDQTEPYRRLLFWLDVIGE